MMRKSILNSRTVARVVAAAFGLVLLNASAAPFRISASQGLAFGTFAGNTGGAVNISVSGARSATGGVALLSAAGGSMAQFLVTGNGGLTYTITLPSSAILSSGTKSMVMDNFVSSPSASSASTGLLNGAGSQTLYVGARLNVPASLSAGTYTGSFSVTVNLP